MSQRFQLSGPDWPSLLKSFLLALSGVIGTFLIQWATHTDFGQYTMVIAATIPFLVNMFLKWVGAEQTNPPANPAPSNWP